MKKGSIVFSLKTINDGIAIFTDVSLDPRLRLGVGVYLFVPPSLLEGTPRSIKRSEIAERIMVQRFEDTSSTRLEVQTVLWALEECQKALMASGQKQLHLYSDSQCVAGLLRRRPKLEGNGFISNSSKRPLKNASLYRTFFQLHDQLGFEVIKVQGHSRSSSHDTVHRIFSFADKEVRQALTLWTGELEHNHIEGMTRDCRKLNHTDKSNDDNWCVYVLKCRNNYLYIGLTNNIDRRLKEHDLGTGSKFVRSRRPFELVKTIPCRNAGEARRLEYNLKRLQRNKKIEVLGIGIEQ